MFVIRRLPAFDAWFAGLRDGATRIRLARRLDKVQRGSLGDVKPVGDGVFEMREFFGPGWRLYYVARGGVLIVMLGGVTRAPSRPTSRPPRPWPQPLRSDAA